VSAARVQNEIREFLSIFTDCATPQDAGMLRWRPQEITFCSHPSAIGVETAGLAPGRTRTVDACVTAGGNTFASTRLRQ
jgi:hypothetical protein